MTMNDVWFFDVNYAFSSSKTYLSKRLYLRQTGLSRKENRISKEQSRKENIHDELNTINRGEMFTDIYILGTYATYYFDMNAFFYFDLFIVYIPECKQQLKTMK